MILVGRMYSWAVEFEAASKSFLIDPIFVPE